MRPFVDFGKKQTRIFKIGIGTYGFLAIDFNHSETAIYLHNSHLISYNYFHKRIYYKLK